MRQRQRAAEALFQVDLPFISLCKGQNEWFINIIILHAFRKIREIIAPRETVREGPKAKPEGLPGGLPRDNDFSRIFLKAWRFSFIICFFVFVLLAWAYK